MGRDEMEEWLCTQVRAAYDELRAYPESAVTLDQVRATLAAERAKTKEEK
jgi:hypothetical protein